jgi:hypothetical protein
MLSLGGYRHRFARAAIRFRRAIQADDVRDSKTVLLHCAAADPLIVLIAGRQG